VGHSSADGVVDSYGRVFGHERLYVSDGSILPGPVGVNPSMTIAALGERIAKEMIA
jgi:cholesterol oxidase